MPETLTQRITRYDTAINEITEGAQSATVEGFSYTRGTLFRLQSERNKLQMQKDRTNGVRPLVKHFSFNGRGYAST